MSLRRFAGGSRTGRQLTVRPFAVAVVAVAAVAATVLPLGTASGATQVRRASVRGPAALTNGFVGAARSAPTAQARLLADEHAPRVAIGATGTISGRVTDNHGSPLSGICVEVQPVGAGTGGFTTSAVSTGTYVVPNLAAGVYTVSFFAGCGSVSNNWVQQWWKNTDFYEDATDVSVAAGKTTSGIDAAMQPGATISGTVTNESDAPLSDICVFVDSTEGLGSDTETSDGSYTVSALAPGSYTIEFSPCGAGVNLLPQWWNDSSTEAGATLVTLGTGATRTGINATMKPGGIATGTVKGNTGAVLADICVYYEGVNVPTPGTFESSTNASGVYQIVGLPTGSYIVAFYPCTSTQNWLVQYWKDSATADESTVVSVTAGATTSGVSPRLQPGGKVTGTVRRSGGGPLGGICVNVELANGSSSSYSATTAGNGTFSVSNLPSGTYVAEFTAGCGSSSYNWMTQYSGGAATAATAKTIVVRAGSTTSGVTASLHAGGEIAGTVTGHGAKLAGMCMAAFNSQGEEEASTTTASNGSYLLVALASGSYEVQTSAGCGSTSSDWAPQWFRAASTQAAATSVHVAAGKTTSGVNLAVTVGGTINGTVTIAGGGAVVDGCVVAYPVVPGFADGDAETSGTGTYSIPGLTPGKYVVSFEPQCGTSNALPDYYTGASTPKAAKQLMVVAGKAVVANARLAKGAELSGTVTVASKAPLSGACVEIFSASSQLVEVKETETATNGTYSVVGLPAGKYLVEFADCSEVQRYATQWYKDRTSPATATRITLRAGASVTGVSAQMTGGGSISGRVRRSASTGEAAVCVYAESVNDANGGGYTTTTGNGSYAIYGLEPGRYDIEFEPSCIGQTFAAVWYKAGLYEAKSTPVMVSAGHTTSGVNVTLSLAGEISGTVKAGSTPIVGACVEAYFAHTDIEANGTESFADGSYLMGYLTPGAYDVYFDPSCASTANLAPQWWKKASDEAKSTTVTVRAGRDSSGINAAFTGGGQILGHREELLRGRSAGRRGRGDRAGLGRDRRLRLRRRPRRLHARRPRRRVVRRGLRPRLDLRRLRLHLRPAVLEGHRLGLGRQGRRRQRGEDRDRHQRLARAQLDGLVLPAGLLRPAGPAPAPGPAERAPGSY